MSVEDVDNTHSGQPARPKTTLEKVVGSLGGSDALDRIEALAHMDPHSLDILTRGLKRESGLSGSVRLRLRPRGRRRFSASLGFDF